MKATVEFPVVDLLGGKLSEEQARAIFAQGEEAVVFALLQLARERDELAQKLNESSTNASPSTPSGMLPIYTKPSVSKRRKKPGRKAGHEGSKRPSPPRIDQQVEHTLKQCPDCSHPVSKPVRKRKRIIEDIPETTPVATEHTIHGYYCAHCDKIVEPVVADALPGATIGLHLLALSAWLHYGLGNTLSQIVSVLNYHLHFPISQGGLVQMWYRLQNILYVWYEQIGAEARDSAVLHADETGWRVSGIGHWLWCFTSKTVTYYLIDRSRGEPALKKFFTEVFQGILITDFWGPYDKIQCAFKQKCLPHLFRELKKVNVRNKSSGWQSFEKKLKRLLKDALRLGQREDLPNIEYAAKRSRLDTRLDRIIESSWPDADAKRLVKRLNKYRDDLFTFLDQPDVPADNNHGEREIRPAVIIRKNSLCNRSENGAHMQAVMMSIYRTLKMRGHNPIQTITAALRQYLLTAKLPPLPPPTTSLG